MESWHTESKRLVVRGSFPLHGSTLVFLPLPLVANFKSMEHDESYQCSSAPRRLRASSLQLVAATCASVFFPRHLFCSSSFDERSSSSSSSPRSRRLNSCSASPLARDWIGPGWWWRRRRLRCCAQSHESEVRGGKPEITSTILVLLILIIIAAVVVVVRGRVLRNKQVQFGFKCWRVCIVIRHRFQWFHSHPVHNHNNAEPEPANECYRCETLEIQQVIRVENAKGRLISIDNCQTKK